MSIDESQRAAAHASAAGAQKIMAGAGTGKTTTMVHRFAHLVSAGGLDPNRIAAVTFTNKAAAELRARITDELLARGLIPDRASLDMAWIGTFHGLCMRLLREDCYEIGFDRDTRVIDQLEERLLIRGVQDALRDDRVDDSGILAMEAIGIEGAMKLSADAFGFIQRMKGMGLTPHALHHACAACARHYWRDAVDSGGGGAGPDERIAEDEAARLICATYAEYERRLHARGTLDFDGILLRTLENLRANAGWARRCRERFQYMIVDEFQDTSRVQLAVLQLLSHEGFANVSVVGDAKQSIYGWRDARLQHLLEFAGTEHRLITNYRSAQPILDMATHVIRGDAQFAGEPALQAHTDGTAGARPDAQPGDAVSLFRAGSPEEEARFVATTIAGLRRRGRAWSDIAILTRMRTPPIAFEQELRRAGIPYVTAGGYGFFDREEVKDVMAWLAVIENPLADEALTRVLQGPAARVTDGELYRLVRGRLGTSRSALHTWDALTDAERDGLPELHPRTATRVAAMLSMLRGLGDDRAGKPVTQLVQEVIERTAGAALATGAPAEASRRSANLRKLYRMAGDFEASSMFSGIGDFLAYVALHDEYAIEVAEADVAESDAVRFMTVHAAKGLEFPVVFFAHVKPFRATHRGWMFFDEEMGLILKTLGDTRDPETAKHRRWKADRGAAGTLPMDVERSELRRLVYVALTRARDQVFISATRRNEPDWGAVFSDLDDRGHPRKAAEDDHFRTMALHVRDGGAGRLLEGGAEPETGPISAAATADKAPVRERLALPPSGAVRRDADAPERTEVSFTQLEVLAQCPLRYRYMFEWSVPAPADDLRPDSARHENAIAASTLGTIVHATLERFHQPGQPATGRAADEIRPLWMAAADGVIDARAAEALWAADARTMFEHYLRTAPATMETIATEQEVNLVTRAGGAEVLIRGFIDRLCRTADGSVLVVDYKTNRGMPAATRAAHDRQLAIYRTAVVEALGVTAEVGAVVVEMRTGELHWAAASGWNEVEGLLRRLVDGDRAAPPRPPCSGCAYSLGCPSSTRGRRP